MIRVAIVDDEQLLRAGLRMILDSEDDITVVGEAGDGRAGVELVQRARPDVVLMDVQMPRLDGVAATREIVATSHAKVVILTTFDRDDYPYDALRAGAAGFMLKNVGPEQLLMAVREVADGRALLSPQVTRRVIAHFVRHRADPSEHARIAELSSREREVLTLMTAGLNNAEIAATLVVGEATVKTHVGNVLAKTNSRDRVQAVVLGHALGLAAPPNQ
jgi:DNA-binding NarL/FixJ family response regulator